MTIVHKDTRCIRIAVQYILQARRVSNEPISGRLSYVSVLTLYREGNSVLDLFRPPSPTWNIIHAT
jgi:hypothetical protein